MQEYAVACAVARYLHENDLRWPENWDQLEPSFVAEARADSPWSFNELRSRVSIRFDVDRSELIACCTNKDEEVQFDGIRAPDHQAYAIQSNTFIIDYVRFLLDNGYSD